MRLSVTLSANAGVALHVGGRRIWVDALHEKKQKGFSTLSPDRLQQMRNHDAFSAPEYLCYTHTHPDHYSQRLTDAARKLWPSCVSLVPDNSWGAEHCVTSGDLTLRFLKLPHEGAQYADVSHYGILISCQGRNILIPGDCEVASEALLEAVGNTPIHLMLLDFPWVTLHRGAKFLKANFPNVPKILFHLPFARDDTMGYRSVTERRTAEMKDVQILQDFLQTVTVEI